MATSYALTIPDVAIDKIIADTGEPLVTFQSRGTVFCCNPSAQTAPQSTVTITKSLQQNQLSINAPLFMPTMGPAAPVAPASLTVQGLAQLLAASKKDHHLEWKLSEYNGDPLQWHEWFGQFKTAMNSASATDDVKLT